MYYKGVSRCEDDECNPSPSRNIKYYSGLLVTQNSKPDLPQLSFSPRNNHETKMSLTQGVISVPPRVDVFYPRVVSIHVGNVRINPPVLSNSNIFYFPSTSTLYFSLKNQLIDLRESRLSYST